MSFRRLPLNELSDRIQSTVSRHVGIRLPIHRSSIVFAICQAISGVIHLIYCHLEWLSKQLFPDTADSLFLEKWANAFGIQRQASKAAKVSVRFMGTPGSEIPKEVEIIRVIDNISYLTIESAKTDSTGNGLVKCICVTPGTLGNLLTSTNFQLVRPLKGIVAENLIPVEGTLDPGYDAETDQELLKRLLKRLRNRGRGGSADDYRFWAQSFEGVGRVWPFANERRPGAIDLFFITEDIDNPIPSDELLDQVQAALNKEKPLGVIALAAKPTQRLIHIEIKTLAQVNDLKSKVISALKKFLFEESQMRSTVSTLQLKQVISLALQSEAFFLNLPTKDIDLNEFEFPSLGEVKWT